METPPTSMSRHSLEPPCGLPSPIAKGSPAAHDGDTQDTDDGQTLISCMSHLSVCSLPPPPPPYSTAKDGRGREVSKHRFPDLPSPRPSSRIASRSQQRRIYLGPKLSDRATGGPDAGPLIERFSCLFKDRKCQFGQIGISS
jgi:1-aminocyclopropane-1-carboxylate synthase